MNCISIRKGCKLEQSTSEIQKELETLTVTADNQLEGIMVQVTFMRSIIFSFRYFTPALFLDFYM